MSQQGETLSARRGDLSAAHLVFEGGVAGLRVEAGSALDGDLYRATFATPGATIEHRDATVRVRGHARVGTGSRRSVIILDGTVTWHVRVLGEASDLELDLGEASVDLITIDGGATDLTMSLSEPADNTFVGLHGGVRDARIHLPRGTNAAVSVRGDARDLVLDWQEWESTRDVEWRTRGWESARVRYVFELSGGITDLRLQFSS